MTSLYVGSARASGNGNCSLHKLAAADGSIIWSRDTGAIVRSVAINSGNTAVYCGGDRASNLTTHKYTSGGALSWSADHGAIVVSVSLDAAENLLTAGQYNATVGCHARKYASNGTEDTSWRKQILFSTGIVYGVHAGPDGNLYFCGDPTTILKDTKMYGVGGAEQWSILAGSSSTVRFGVVADSSGNFHVVGDRASSITLKKYNSSRSLQWSANHGASVYGVALDAGGNVYTGGARSSSLTTRKYNSAGSLQWSADHGATVNGICVDTDGNVYTAGNTSSGVNIRKYNSSGTLQWSKSLSENCYAIAVEQSSGTVVAAPALAIPLGLGAPTFSNSVDVPALAIPLGLGAPTFSESVLPPDPLLFELPPQSLYRALLIDGTGGLEIPLASFQCRRRLGESTWLAVQCPTYSAALAAAIAARIGAALVIRSGVRSAASVETLGDFLQSILTEYEYERQPWGAALTLTGRVVPSAHAAQPRALVGIQTRGQDEQGRKRVTCAVDPQLRPGDTATALDWSFTVGAILYFIGAREAWMKVTESG